MMGQLNTAMCLEGLNRRGGGEGDLVTFLTFPKLMGKCGKSLTKETIRKKGGAMKRMG